jgi:Holliday junction resolvase RusA-like endonuclease
MAMYNRIDQGDVCVAKITLLGRPITKKNHGQIIYAGGKPKIIPSATCLQYVEDCLWQLKGAKKHIGLVHMIALYWMPNRSSWPDLAGLIQNTQDILQAAHVIGNDRDVVSLDGSRIVGVDKQNPRAEITVIEIREVDNA